MIFANGGKHSHREVLFVPYYACMAKITSSNTYTDDEIAANVAESFQESLVAIEHQERGRRVRRASPTELYELKKKIEQDAARSSVGGVVLARHGLD